MRLWGKEVNEGVPERPQWTDRALTFLRAPRGFQDALKKRGLLKSEVLWGTLNGLRGVSAAPVALLAHIVVGPEPVAGSHILAALEPALTLAAPIAIALAHTARPIIPTVVHVPVCPPPEVASHTS